MLPLFRVLASLLMLGVPAATAGRKSQTFYLDSQQCTSRFRLSETQEHEQEQAFDGAVVYSHAAAPQVLALLKLNTNSNFSQASQLSASKAASNEASGVGTDAAERRLLQDFERFAARHRLESTQLLYPHNLDCQLTLRAADKKKIMFYFDYLDIHDSLPNGDCNDALYMFAHPNVYAAALEQVGGNSGLCGATNVKRIFTTTATYLTLSFRTNDRLPNGLGFRIVVTAFTEADENGECASSQQDDADTFRCKRGPCINSALRCDGVDNCGDGSDERDCVADGTKEKTDEDSLLARFMHLGVSASLVIAVGSILIVVLIVGTAVCFCMRRRPQQSKWSNTISTVESGKLAVPLTNGQLLLQSSNSLITGSASPHQAGFRTSECASSLKNVTNASSANQMQPPYATPSSVHSAPFFCNANGNPNLSTNGDLRFAETAIRRDVRFVDGQLIADTKPKCDIQCTLLSAGQSSATSSSLAMSTTPSMARTAPITIGNALQAQQLTHAFHNRSMNLNVAAPSFSASQYSQYRAASRKRPRHRVAASNQVPPSVQLTNPNSCLVNSYYANVQSAILGGMQHPSAFASTPTSSRSAKSFSGLSRSSVTTGSNFAPQLHMISNAAYSHGAPAYQNGVLGLGFGQVVQAMIIPKCGTDTDGTSSSFSPRMGGFDASSSTDDDAEIHAELLAKRSAKEYRNDR